MFACVFVFFSILHVVRRSDFVCRVKYCNNLPDVPFDPKFLLYPFDQNRFVLGIFSAIARYVQFVMRKHTMSMYPV